MKGKLHFIVFAVGAVVGIVLAVVGSGMKSDLTAEIVKSEQALQSPKSLPTKGDFAEAKRVRASYDKSVKSSSSRLNKEGKNLTSSLTGTTPNPNTFRSSATGEIENLERRANALKVKDARAARFHEWIKGDKLDIKEANAFKALQDELNGLNDQAAVKPFQVRLVLINEFLTIAEVLLKKPQFKDGSGLEVVSWKFQEMNSDQANNDEQPFVRLPFSVQFRADAGLATAIVDEFLNPSKNTSKSGPEDDSPIRQNFPVSLTNFSMKQGKRPSLVYVDVPNKDAKLLGLNPELIEGEGGWNPAMKDLAKKMGNLEDELRQAHLDALENPSEEEKKRVLEADYTDDVRFTLPVECSLGLVALKLNKKWKAINKQEVTDE